MLAWERTSWSNGIVFRSLAAVALITMLLGGISSFVIRAQVVTRDHQAAQQRLSELLDTVESTASVATFANDDQLAREVVQGLLRSSEVLRVVIYSGEIELARAERSVDANAIQPTVLRPLFSPFKKGQVIGRIRLDANWDEISRRVAANSRNAVLVLFGQLLLVIAGTAGMVFLVVVRPIKATSDRLHRLDPANGGALEVPEGHARTEIGRLVGDINELTGRLLSTLNQERELREQQEISQRKYQNLFDHASSGIFVADKNGKLASYNPAFVKLTWLPRSATSQLHWLTDTGWDNSEKLLELLGRSADQQIACAGDFLLRGRRGDERWLHIAVLPLGDGSMQGTVTDVTERKRDEISARRLAVTDSLTGFANREGLLQAFAGLNAKESEALTVIMVDLEGFKQLNDAKGFHVGDQLLLGVAGRIREGGQAFDFLSRIGGDAFVLVVSGLSDQEALRPRVEALHEQLRDPYVVDQESIQIGVRIGIAFFPGDGVDMPQLLRGAELALNFVRESNRSAGFLAYKFFEPQLQVVVEHRRRLEDELRVAVNCGELRLAFQPIVDLNTGTLAGAEALLRWQHAERGFISPDVFIPLAERVGLIGEIGRRVLDEACRQVAEWRRDGLDIYVSVNVSVCQIPDDLSPEIILSMLDRHGLPPQAVAIEITEGVLMSDVSIAQRWIEQLRAAGLRIYLDDFGTGYSSLSYLKRFPMDTVKIDKSFIVDMNSSNSDCTLVETIITMAGSLGLNVVAEGIEEASQLALLRRLGCGYGQGYFFSRPVFADDFVAIARRINSESGNFGA